MYASGGVDRRFYELCALAELRDRLRAGDIWVTGSRQYRDFETYLIPAATFEVMHKEPLPLDVDTHLPSYLAECRQRLEDNLTTVACKAREKTLPDVTLADGDLHIAPLRKNTPESAEVFAEKAYALNAARQDYRTARRGRSVDESRRSILASAHPGAAQKSAGSPHCGFGRWH